MDSTAARWTARIVKGIVLVFFAFDCIVKLLQLPVAIQATTQLGYTSGVVFPLGVVTLVLWILYAVPRTAVVGALLWTAYLGGAVATHVRVGDPLATLAPVYAAILLWLPLFLRDARVRALLLTSAQKAYTVDDGAVAAAE